MSHNQKVYDDLTKELLDFGKKAGLSPSLKLLLIQLVTEYINKFEMKEGI